LASAALSGDLSGDTYEHEIGPWEIKEAYSVAIEVLHGGPAVTNANEFEYLAIERILGKARPVDERPIAAICHWALQDSVPGVRFFEIVAFLEGQHIERPGSPRAGGGRGPAIEPERIARIEAGPASRGRAHRAGPHRAAGLTLAVAVEVGIATAPAEVLPALSHVRRSGSRLPKAPAKPAPGLDALLRTWHPVAITEAV
jgi:hypothetical protein